MEPRAIIQRVVEVQPHPESDHLDIVKIGGAVNVANRPSPDQPRYQVGDLAVVLVENLVLPEWLLKHMDLWDDAKSKGVLAGSKGNRTKGRSIAGVRSDVALCKVTCNVIAVNEGPVERRVVRLCLPGDSYTWLLTDVVASDSDDFDPSGMDMTEKMKITAYVPA